MGGGGSSTWSRLVARAKLRNLYVQLFTQLLRDGQEAAARAASLTQVTES
jgi:hypothetical protein